MVDVFEYDAELNLKCHDGDVTALRTKIVTLGTGDLSARSVITEGGSVGSALLAFGVNGYTGVVKSKVEGGGSEGLDKFIIEFDLTDTTPDLLKKGYDKARAIAKIEPTSFKVQ